jgi:hypothetical protein
MVNPREVSFVDQESRNGSIAGRSSFKSRVTNWFQQLRSVYSGALSTTFEACKKVSAGSAASGGHDIFGRGDWCFLPIGYNVAPIQFALFA